MSFFNSNIANSGLFAAQKGLQVTQNNIANADTEGYARQRVETNQSTNSHGFGLSQQSGNGVVVKEITRIVDQYLINETRDQESKVGYYTSRENALSEIETVFNEHTDQSVTNRIMKFFNAWEEASKFPEDVAYRQSLIGEGKLLASSFNTISEKITDLKSVLDNRIENQLDKINDLTKKIQDINNKMNLTAVENPNSLLDERDRYIDELSSVINVDVIEGQNNNITLKVGGFSLLSNDERYELVGMYDKTNGEWTLGSGDVVIRPKGGSIAADLEVRNVLLKNYETKMNSFIGSLITEVNNLHQAGYGLDDSTGNVFFTGLTGSNIKVDSLIEDNPQKIAMSSALATPGNTDIAKEIIDLKEQELVSLGNKTLTEYHNQFVFEMTSDLNFTKNNRETHENMLININEQRQNVQGINMDEEMSNLLKYQKFYQANSKVLKTLSDTFDQLMNII